MSDDRAHEETLREADALLARLFGWDVMHLADSDGGYWRGEILKVRARIAAVSGGAAHPPAEERCGSFGCTLPKGHNMGRADIPENHRAHPPGGKESSEWCACSGARDCSAKIHTHGCFADYGFCTEPWEHDTAASSSAAAGENG